MGQGEGGVTTSPHVIEVESIRLRRHQAGPCSPWPGRKGVTSRRTYYFINPKLCLHVGQTQSLKSGIQSSPPRSITPEIWPSLELKAVGKRVYNGFWVSQMFSWVPEGHKCLADSVGLRGEPDVISCPCYSAVLV